MWINTNQSSSIACAACWLNSGAAVIPDPRGSQKPRFGSGFETAAIVALALFASAMLEACVKPVPEYRGLTSCDLPAPRLNGVRCRDFSFCSQFTFVTPDEHWMLLLLEAVNREGARSDVICGALGGETSHPDNWAGRVWTAHRWAAAMLAYNTRVQRELAPQFFTGESGNLRWTNVDSSEILAWRTTGTGPDANWKIRFATFEEMWRFALDPEEGLDRVMSRLSGESTPILLDPVLVEAGGFQDLVGVFVGRAIRETRFGTSIAWLAWSESVKNPKMRIWVAAWGLVGQGNFRLIAGRAIETPSPELPAPDPSDVASLYPIELRVTYQF